MSMRNPSPMMRYWDWLDYQDIKSTMYVWPNSWGTDAARRRREYYEAVPDFDSAIMQRITTDDLIRNMSSWVVPQDDTGGLE